MKLNPELLLNEYMALGEGPLWDEEEKALYWVDTDNMRIHSYKPENDYKETYQLDQKIGVAVKESKDTIICALESGIYRFNQVDQSLEMIACPEKDNPMNIFNDGKCDSQGNFWIGSVHRDELDNMGTLFCISPDNEVKAVLDGISISNGMAWTEDYSTMYYIDSPTRKVFAYDFDQKHCELSNCRVAVDLSHEEGMPDGMTIDVEGNIWVAVWGGNCVYKCNPKTGEIIDKIDLPVSNVTCCTFGGDNLDELFITTAMAELTEEELNEQPLAGGLFKLKTDTKGFCTKKFGISTKSL